MKSFTLFIGLAMLFAANAGAKGVEAHGGDAVVCEKATGQKTAETFDRFEGYETGGLVPDLGPSTLPYEQKVERFLARIEARDVLRARAYRDAYALYQASSAFMNRASIKEIDDSREIITPAGDCYKIQAAVQRLNPKQFEKKFIFDNAIWTLMDEDSKAMLVQHEIIYLDEIAHGAEISDGVRLYNAVMSSGNGDKMSAGDYANLVAQNLRDGRVTVVLNGAIVYYAGESAPKDRGTLAAPYQGAFAQGRLACGRGATVYFAADGSFEKCSSGDYTTSVKAIGGQPVPATFKYQGGNTPSLALGAGGEILSGTFTSETAFPLKGAGRVLHCPLSPKSVVAFDKDGAFNGCDGGWISFRSPADQALYGRCESPVFYPSGEIKQCGRAARSMIALPAMDSEFACAGVLSLDEAGNAVACSRGEFAKSVTVQGFTVRADHARYNDGIDRAARFSPGGICLNTLRILGEAHGLAFKTVTGKTIQTASYAFGCGSTSAKDCRVEAAIRLNADGLVTYVSESYYKQSQLTNTKVLYDGR